MDLLARLVYYEAPNGTSLLLGAMYVADGNKAGPLIGGALTSWHSHTNLCVNGLTGTALNKRADGTCPPGSAVKPTGQMLHVWSVARHGHYRCREGAGRDGLSGRTYRGTSVPVLLCVTYPVAFCAVDNAG